jgi:hypothetical protein
MEKVYTWTTPEQAVKAEGDYWRRCSIEERVAAVETLRQATVGIYGDAPARLERVYRFVELEEIDIEPA